MNTQNTSKKLLSIGTYGLHVMQFPSGKFGYVGTIPEILCDKKIGKFGEHYDSKVFDTKQEAVNYFEENLHLIEYSFNLKQWEKVTSELKPQKNTAIPIVKNNEGENIFIAHHIYEELKKDYNDGVWSVIITGLDKKTHVIILPEQNFKS